MNPMKKILAVTTFLAIGLLCISCGSDDDGGTGTPAQPIDVSGVATKAGITGATVNLFQFDSSGGMGALVAGPFTTAAGGAWSGEVPAGTAKALLVVIDGGSYTDESTGNTVDVTEPMYGIWKPTTKRGNASPVTHAIVLNAQERVNGGASISEAVTGALVAMESALGFDPTSVVPVIPTKSQPGPFDKTAQNYGVLLAGFSQILNGNAALSGFASADVWGMVLAVASDLSDGVLNGEDVFGNAIMVDPDGAGGQSPINWPALDPAGIGALITAANAWSTANSAGVTLPNINLGDFGDTDVGGGGAGVTGTLSASGSGAAEFGSSFAPTSAGYSINEVVAVFTCGEPLNGKALTISVTRNPDKVISIAAARITSSWGAGATQGGSVPGVTFTDNGNSWTFSFSNVTLDAAQGKAGQLTFNGSLTFNEQEIPE